MANDTTTYKALALPTRLLLHPTAAAAIGGDQLRAAAETATMMRRTTTSGQTWRNAVDLNLVKSGADLRVDSYIAATAEHQSSLLMREDGIMLLSDIDEATAGVLCHLSKTLKTTFSVRQIPATMAGTAALFRENRADLVGKLKSGPFQDGFYWTNVAHVNDAPDVVKRHKIKTGEIQPDADKKADAKEKKKAAVKAAGGETPAAPAASEG
jgi:hypothetical protein